CNQHPAFPAPSDIEEGETRRKLGRNAPRERELTSPHHTPPSCPAKAGIQYPAASRLKHGCLWNTGSSAFADDDSG
ncbi:hypothetical protein, partial [Bradyrhizobium sp. Leo170]|uniref:hypothetical protein n=1 Tax=Bradyrhizobium sp. Leo170 TaxID=1571199 RepID=UPI001A929BEC